MHPRPIHRTKTFWLGILILLFLAWAHLRSLTHHDSIGYGSPTSPLHLLASSRAGSIAWQSGEMPAHWIAMPPGWSTTSQRRPGKSTLISLSEPLEITTAFGPLWIELAYWFLALLFLIPWVAFLHRRHRRHRRIPPTPTPPPSEAA